MANEKVDPDFYKDAIKYWSKIPPTVQGMLGGFDFISDTDIDGSKKFLEDLLRRPEPPATGIALDCGAGIGRVTKCLLSKFFNTVDLVEQNESFLEKAKEFVNSSKMGTTYAVGLQEFVPEKKYDVIWNQWVLGHLEDGDLIKFLTLCSESLNENGLIIIKENVTSSQTLEKDDEDSSVTRSLKHILTIFRQANLKIIKECKQKNFPKGIYPVYMFALKSNNMQSLKDKEPA